MIFNLRIYLCFFNLCIQVVVSINMPPLQKLKEKLFDEKKVSVSVLRLDQIHPSISGNKWYKLKYNVEEFFRLKKKYFVTFGGAYSNHIVATAAAGKEFGMQTIGIIRGDELHGNSNDVLKFAGSCGMKLLFISREEYKKMRKDKTRIETFLSVLNTKSSELFVLPEGGSSLPALKGCAEIAGSILEDFDSIICACGTGTTLAGISSALNKNQKAIGISVLKDADFLDKNIVDWNEGRNNFHIVHDYHFGGYAKSNRELVSFCDTFYSSHQIKIEPVYTGKLFFGLYNLISTGFFAEGTRIVAVHTGGVHQWNS